MDDQQLPTSLPQGGQILIYHDGATNLQVRLDGQTVWLTQAAMAELFQTTKQNISLHIQNILEENELQPEAVVKEYLTTAADGKRYRTLHYNLDMILAVGYRVRSPRGTALPPMGHRPAVASFWSRASRSTTNASRPGELSATTTSTNCSPASAIFAPASGCSIRRSPTSTPRASTTTPNAEMTRQFFQIVQNKMHWAAHGHTAAEIVRQRADATKPHMGLTSWKNAPGGPVRKTDVAIAKNYLTQPEIEALNLIVSAYLDFAELQARSHRPMHMADWIAKLDDFLRLSDREILTHAGNISHQLAEEHAHAQYALHEQERRRLEAEQPTSDFDRAVEKLTDLTTSQREATERISRAKKSGKKRPKGDRE